MHAFLRCVLAAMTLVASVQNAAPASESVTFQWAKKFSGFGFPIGGTVDPSGNAIFAHRGSSIQNCVLIKADPSGSILWAKDNLPNVGKIVSDANGSVYVAGSLVGLDNYLGLLVGTNHFSKAGVPTAGYGSAYVAKLSPGGNIEWARHFGNSLFMSATGIALEADGSYVVAGFYSQGSAQIGSVVLPAAGPDKAGNVFAAKFGPDGEVEWARAGVGNYTHASPKIETDRAGYVVMVATAPTL
jgi:hypothetical protein